MTKQTEALKMAIEALETAEIQSEYDGLSKLIFEAINACKEALAEQPTQEPVLYIDQDGLDGHATWAQATRCQDSDIALYTHPPKQWQGLSDAEMSEIFASIGWVEKDNNLRDLGFYNHSMAIEAKLREKNT